MAAYKFRIIKSLLVMNERKRGKNTGMEVIKRFSCFKHDILNAHKYKNISKFGIFRLR